jgi:hypothetical protein
MINIFAAHFEFISGVNVMALKGRLVARMWGDVLDFQQKVKKK